MDKVARVREEDLRLNLRSSNNVKVRWKRKSWQRDREREPESETTQESVVAWIPRKIAFSKRREGQLC